MLIDGEKMYVGGLITRASVLRDQESGSDESFYNQIEVERDCCFS